MRYNFDKIVNRKNTNSIKWDFYETFLGAEDLFPMWVADMDFKAPPEVVKAVTEVASHGIYGYSMPGTRFYEAVIEWCTRRYDFTPKKEWILNTPGIVLALNAAVQAYTNPGDGVIIQTPVYYPFMTAVKNNGRKIVDNTLIEKNGYYSIDFDDLEKKIDRRTKLFLLSSPHNPGGRVWNEYELKKLGDICREHGITIVSDEIHADIIFGNRKHIPLASLSPEIADITVTCIAPSKTFNIAGVQSSAIVIKNEKLRNEFQQVLHNLGIYIPNIFAIEAMTAAYTYGEKWLSELIPYLEGNIDFATDFINRQIPGISTVKPESTFLLWLDCSELGMGPKEMADFMYNRAKVGLNNGVAFGKAGAKFMRMNVGCPRKSLEIGLEKIRKACMDLNLNP